MSERSNIADVYPLSPVQEGMLFHTLYNPQSGMYIDQISCRLQPRHKLSPEALEGALEVVLERHSALRTVFAYELKDRPRQVVVRKVKTPFRLLDWSELDPEAQQQRLAAELAEERRVGFDLTKPPLLRLTLVRLDRGAWFFVLSYHHILLDAWSVSTVVRELFTVYDRLRQGEDPVLEPTRPFREFIDWLERRPKELDEAYWRSYLGGFEAPTSLGSDRAASEEDGWRYDDLEVELSSVASQNLERLARRERLTLSNVVQAAWGLLLARRSGERDVLFGATVSGRPIELPGVETTVGLFINTLGTRCHADPRAQLLPWLGTYQQRQFEQRGYEHSPLVAVQGWSSLAPGVPLFESLLVFENVPVNSSLVQTGADLGLTTTRYDPKTNYPLTLLLVPGERLAVRALFDRARFDRTTVCRLLGQYLRLLEGVASGAVARLGELPLLGPAERHQLLRETNDTEREAALPTVLARISAVAAAQPDAVALQFEDRFVSYREMMLAVGAVAKRLDAAGVRAGARVPVLLQRSELLPIALLAVHATGAAYVPLDPSYPRQRVETILAEAAEGVVLTQADLEFLLADVAARGVLVEAEIARQPSSTLDAVAGDPLAVAYVIYTSGSTGKPKGVVLGHAGLSSFLDWFADRCALERHQRWLALTSVAFDIAALELFLPLWCGATVVVLGREQAMDGFELGAMIARLTPTVVQATPATWRALLESGWAGEPDLRILCGGEALPRALAESLVERGRQLLNLYGPTETTIWSAVEPVVPDLGPVPIGRPIANTRCYVVDERFEPMPVGSPGRLYLAGVGLAHGYLGRPRLTAERFVPDPHDTRSAGAGARMYWTGDLARLLPDGRLEFLGRLDHQVKLRGYRIELEEIEAVLGRHPEVGQAVVALRTEDPERPVLAAYLTRRSVPSPTSDWRSTRVDAWQGVWQDTYAGVEGTSVTDLNLAGWKSSYTGEPIPVEDMRLWIDGTVARIRRLLESGPTLLSPSAEVLEIGCGTGLLLLRLLPHCAHYTGADFSRAALDFVASRVPANDRARVRLVETDAAQLDALGSARYDVIVFNSVVQYFPDLDYFLAVLEQAVARLKPGGRLFVGDVRSLRHLEVFHRSLELARAAPAADPEAVRRAARERAAVDPELVLDPGLFAALGSRLPRVRGVRIETKPPGYDNELSRFRVDVSLELDEEPTPMPEARIGWAELGGDWDALRQRLRGAEGRLVVSAIPDERLAPWREGDPGRPQASATTGASVLASLIELARELGLEVLVGPAVGGSFADLDAAFLRPGPSGRATFLPVTKPTPEAFAAGRWANQPWRAHANESLVEEALTIARESLPEYMVPSAVVVLDRLPLTPNGKLDRKALPPLSAVRANPVGESAQPTSAAEEIIVGLFRQVLGLESVSSTADFFDLGGHSLLATQLSSRLRKAFGVDVALRTIFEARRPRDLAAKVEEALRGGASAPPPILPRPAGEAPELSFAQQRLWLVAQLHPESAAYNIPAALRFEGPLDVSALRATLSEIVRRHEALRTRFPVVEGSARPWIAEPTRRWLPILDLSGLSADSALAETRSQMARACLRPFDLGTDDLLRTTVLRLGAEDHVLFFVVHHIVVDIWSVAIFVHELTSLYHGRVSGRPAALRELGVQYADFAAWQRRWLTGDVLEHQLAFWRRRLGSAPPELRFPFERVLPATEDDAGSTVTTRVSAALLAEIEALGRREGVTLFMALLAAFKVLLHRLSGESDLAVGTDIANRNYAETEDLIGFFVNILVLRTDLAGRPTLRQVLARVRETALSAYAHQDLPFDLLVKELRPDRTLSPAALFRPLFVLQNAPRGSLSLGTGVQISGLDVDTDTAKFDLAVFFEETSDGLFGRWNFKRALFAASAIELMAAQFITVLETLVRNPEARLDEIDLRTQTEKDEIAMEQTLKQEEGLKRFDRFKKVRPKGLGTEGGELVKMSELVPGSPFPLLVEPNQPDVSLAGWAEGAVEQIEAKLHSHGALLFRGFDVASVADFEQFASALCPELFGDYGDLPPEAGSKKVYHSTPYPEDKAILFHNESSHMHRWPLKQFFACMLPSEEGGETPIVDCREIYRRLDPALRRRFEEKGLRYVRNFIDGFDVPWTDFFRTDDRAEVEAYCRRAGIEFRWIDDGLHTEQVCPAVARHPKTGELLFFNQIQLHHISCLDAETRASVQTLFSEDLLPRNVYYGDGTPIEDEVVGEILDLYWQTSVAFPWQKGDVIAVDNMITAHARNPFRGKRRIVVAMGEMFDKGNLVPLDR
jgi:amino acid adenylation domain-containing protein